MPQILSQKGAVATRVNSEEWVCPFRCGVIGGILGWTMIVL